MAKLESQTTLFLKAQKFNPLLGMLLIYILVSLILVIRAYLQGKGVFWEPPVFMSFFFVLIFVAATGWRVEVTSEEITVWCVRGGPSVDPQ
jgi:small basic protein